jgi:AcrR family transcriptional regulator
MAYRKTRAIELRKDARRRTLLEAATRLFSRCGYHAATVPMIVAEANSSVGSFYTYFRNKEDVFETILGSLGERIAVVIREARESRSDPLLQMQTALEAGFLYLAQNPQEARILIVESSGLSHRLQQVRRALLRQQADECCKALLANPEVFSTLNPVIAARCLVGAVIEALCCWLEESPNDRMSATEVARAVVDFNSRALLR